MAETMTSRGDFTSEDSAVGGPWPSLSLGAYRLLGRSGLRVSPLALGTMTFGSDWGWGADRDETRKIFSAYVEHGGNFIDTANAYTNGTAEQMVGEFARSRRDQLVIATKYTMVSARVIPTRAARPARAWSDPPRAAFPASRPTTLTCCTCTCGWPVAR